MITFLIFQGTYEQIKVFFRSKAIKRFLKAIFSKVLFIRDRPRAWPNQNKNNFGSCYQHPTIKQFPHSPSELSTVGRDNT